MESDNCNSYESYKVKISIQAWSKILFWRATLQEIGQKDNFYRTNYEFQLQELLFLLFLKDIKLSDMFISALTTAS